MHFTSEYSNNAQTNLNETSSCGIDMIHIELKHVFVYTKSINGKMEAV